MPGQSFGFDYLTADFTNFSVTRFEMRVDGDVWVDVAIPSVADDPNTLTGAHTYVVPLPPLPTGGHSVAFRACNTGGCGAASPEFSFTLVAFTSPANVRIVGGTP